MKRKTSTTPSRVYCYGCLPPSEEDVKAIDQQLFLAHQHYNKLAEVELQRREAFRALRRSYVPELDEVETLIDEVQAKLDAIEEERKDGTITGDQAKLASKPLVEERRELRQRTAPLRKVFDVTLKAANDELKRLKEAYCKKAGSTSPYTQRKARKHALAQMLPDPQWPKQWKQVQEIEEKARADKPDRHELDLQPGTYLAVEAAFAQACKSKRDSSPRSKRPGKKAPELRTRRFDHTGKVGVQLSNKGALIPSEGPFQLDAGNCQVSEIPEGQWATRSGRRHAYATVKLPIGKTHGKKTRYVELPVLIHRRPVGTVKWAYIQVSRSGNRTKYELQLSLESETFTRRNLGAGSCSLNFGWRGMRDGRLRVAYLKDEFGGEREFALDVPVRKALAYPDELKSIGDNRFNEAKETFIEWLKVGRVIPEELRDEGSYLRQWRSHARFAKYAWAFTNWAFGEDRDYVDQLWRIWRTERLEAVPKRDLMSSFASLRQWLAEHGITEEVHMMGFYLELWRRKNKHLYQWECDQRKRAIRRRLDIYRNWAFQLCSTYATINIEDFDMRKVALRPCLYQEQTRQEKLARRHRVQAAVSTLRLALFSASSPGQVIEQPAEDNTRRCEFCGTVHEYDYKKTLKVLCPVCGNEPVDGLEKDQDARNCENQLQRARGEWSPPPRSEAPVGK